MNIVRDGKSYELTPDEIREAYTEQQTIYDRQNISDNLQWIIEGENLKYSDDELQGNQEFLDFAAECSRNLQDSEDMSFTAAIIEGVKRAVQRMELDSRGGDADEKYPV